MIRRPPRSTPLGSSAASDVYKRQQYENIQELSRNSVAALVDRIEIREDKDIDVRLLHADHFASIVAFLNEQRFRTNIIPIGREAV